MQIAVFETVHFEGAYPVIKLFDNGKNQITIFTYESSYRQFQYLFGDATANFTWIVRQSNESRIQFIRRMYKHSNKKRFDILYLNTVSDNHILYALMVFFLKKTRVIVTLHDINGHFSFRPGSGFRSWVRYIGKRALVKVVNEFNVVASTMVENLESRLPASKKVHNVPGSVYEEERRPISKQVLNAIKMVIPGSIDNRRRDYHLAFDLLHEIDQRNLPISIVLLGGISEYGKDIFEKCRQYVSKAANLIFFQTDTVDQPIFDREIDDCHFIWVPSIVNTVVSDGIPETYGLSISSGTLFDVIKHAKPFIVPRELAVPAELESSCFKYESKNQIVPFLESFLGNPDKYSEWARNAVQNSRCYTIENIRTKNPSLFS